MSWPGATRPTPGGGLSLQTVLGLPSSAAPDPKTLAVSRDPLWPLWPKAQAQPSPATAAGRNSCPLPSRDGSGSRTSPHILWHPTFSVAPASPHVLGFQTHRPLSISSHLLLFLPETHRPENQLAETWGQRSQRGEEQAQSLGAGTKIF